MKWICQVCGYIYDEATEKQPFADLSESWVCPLCGAAKSEFRPEGAPAGAVPKPAAEIEAPADLKELTPGQLASLFSNLARGCEKQYKPEESKLFTQLADYFAAITPKAEDATVEAVAALLRQDIDAYPSVRATADAAGDRGAARVCVWGEKVTRMLSSLTEKYQREGETMLEGKSIWVCTVCGFVYIGEKAPELCPVCKVPSWKFEKIEGRA